MTGDTYRMGIIQLAVNAPLGWGEARRKIDVLSSNLALFCTFSRMKDVRSLFRIIIVFEELPMLSLELSLLCLRTGDT